MSKRVRAEVLQQTLARAEAAERDRDTYQREFKVCWEARREAEATLAAVRELCEPAQRSQTPENTALVQVDAILAILDGEGER